MKIHELKSWPESFSLILSHEKQHEFREDDRGFQPGDWLILREWKRDMERFTGAVAIVSVGHIERGPIYGIPEGYCVMAIDLELSCEG